MSAGARRIVVVLGMHRSGTSTIARALQVLGVDLGDNLLPPAPGDNERGYWEDADVHALNMELLHALGHDWHTLEPVTREELEGPVAQSYRARAAEILAAKVQRTGCFGLKDPRISRLIPFWKRVFEDVGVEPSYAVVSRTPLSVARSLAKRDGFDPAKSHYLWLDHMTTSLAQSAGARRVVVDYDSFMDDVASQLRRLGRGLDLAFDESSSAFREFRDGFVTESMRHTRFSLEDLRADPAVPRAVESLFEALQGMSADRVDPDGALVGPLLEYLAKVEDDLAPALAYMRTYEERSTTVARALAEAERRAGELARSLAEAQAQSQATQAQLQATQAQLQATQAQLQATQAQVQAAQEEMRARESESQALRATLAAHEREIASLQQEALEREEEMVRLVAQLNDSAAALDASREEWKRARAAHEQHLATTWSIPRPSHILRVLRDRLRR